MAVTLTVSEIRQALAQAGGMTGEGTPSSAAVGTLFHRVLGELLRDGSPGNLEACLKDLDADLTVWKSHLTRQAYDRWLGPWLTQQAASLQSQGDKVLHLWTAVQQACSFLADICWEITQQGRLPIDLQQWLSAEQQILCEVHRPEWREPVAILGQPDAVLRVPQQHHWCVLEWKLGRASPDVDLGQACLYHLILSRSAESNGQSALAVINFRPHRDEQIFSSSLLVQAQGRLLDLIGKLAGVVTERRVNRAQPVSLKPFIPPLPPPPLPSPDWIVTLRDKLLKVLRDFEAPCKEIRPAVLGPAYVRLFLFPQSKVTQKKVLSQSDQLHLHLALPTPPNMEIVDGAIAIDLPRPDRVSIPFSQLEPHLHTSNPRAGCSQVPVGVGLNGDWAFCDLAASESAHLLVVGTPGSGKSQWLRVALSALMKTNCPDTLQCVLIDPKQNAFTFAESSPFLRRPIYVPGDDETVAQVLDELIAEMERRYTLFSEVQVQDVKHYHNRHNDPLPRIVCMCDEFADLLLHAEGTQGKAERKEIERKFQRLASKGRAAGVHLILATQYPSRQIITSAIQASIGARVALRVSAPLESRIAINRTGAERLLGNGDLLYQCIGTPVRLQGAWLPETEENRIRC